jgi:4-amino-4-deoxy-L-arabinose transferase-like glycosyltransferase
MHKYTRNQQSRVSKSGAGWVQSILLLIASSYLYVNLFTLSHVPIFLFGDQTFFWVYAQRILHGERIYQDFFQFTPPGTDLIYLAAFHLFGVHIWVTNLVVLLLGLSLSYLCFNLAARLMDRHLALLASTIFLVLIYDLRSTRPITGSAACYASARYEL